MDTIEIYLTRLVTVRDGIKFLISQETMPVKLEQHLYNVLIQITREIERAKRAIAALSEARALTDAGPPEGEPELPFVDEAIQKKKTAKS